MKKGYGNKGTKGKSSPMNVSVGSGSRPGKSRIKIESSAPKNDRTMERAPKGWLK